MRYKNISSALLISAALSALPINSSLSQDEVKLGVLMGVTGPLASFIPPIQDAMQMAADEVNNNGGILGGKSLRLVIGDTQAAAQGAVDAATKLVNIENVPAIVGGLASGATLAAASAVVIPNGVPMVSPTSTSPEMTTLQDNDFVFRVVPGDDYQGKVLARIVLDEGIKKVAVTYINNDYGVGIANAFMAAYKAMGGTITGAEKHEDKKASYRAELATLAKGGAEALVLIAYAGGSGIKIVRQSLENGFFERFIGTDGLRDNLLIEQIGAENLAGTFFSSPTSPETSTAKDRFVQAYSAAYESAANKFFIEQSYDATMLLALAIEKAGSLERTAIRDALRAVASPPGEIVEPGDWAKAVKLLAEGKDINYEGASGPHDFDANGDVTGYIGKYIIENGEFKEISVLQ